jgi:predicted metalloprotease with PDZ domain
MKKQIAIFLMALAVALPAAAGGAKCDGSAEELAMMKTKLANKAWLGIEYDKTDAGYFVIEAVHDGSPADQAGFRKGDVLLTMEGEKYTKANKAALKTVWANVEPGSEVEYVVKRDGEKVNLAATLAHVPADLQEKWIAEHMAEYHGDQQLAAKD